MSGDVPDEVAQERHEEYWEKPKPTFDPQQVDEPYFGPPPPPSKPDWDDDDNCTTEGCGHPRTEHGRFTGCTHVPSSGSLAFCFCPRRVWP